MLKNDFKERYPEIQLTEAQLAKFFDNGIFIVNSYNFCAEASWGVSWEDDKDTLEFYDAPTGDLTIQGFLVKFNPKIKISHQCNDTDFSPHYEEIEAIGMIDSIWKVDIEISVEVDILDPSCSGAYLEAVYHASNCSSCKLTPLWSNSNKKLPVLEYKGRYKGDRDRILCILEEILEKSVKPSQKYSDSIEELKRLLFSSGRGYDHF